MRELPSYIILLIAMLHIPGPKHQHYRIPAQHRAGFNGLSVRNDPGEFIFMFYNAENLFDCIDDTATDDEEFLPGGERGWNQSKYHRKLNSLARVILSAGEWDPPALVGMCETENQNVIDDLLSETLLSSHYYKYLYHESTDARGIDLCLLYDTRYAEVLYSESIYPRSPAGDGYQFRGRPVVYTVISIAGSRLHLFLNHWPSRRGGVLAGIEIRNELSGIIRERVDSIMRFEGATVSVIISGDFNSAPGDRETELISKDGLVNLSAGIQREGSGTYRYRGVWQMFDQIIVSEAMIGGKAPLTAGELIIHSPGFLLADDPVYPGKKPFPTYDGYRYSGGYSDHLPVLLTVGAGR